jgi:hypothetical protein
MAETCREIEKDNANEKSLSCDAGICLIELCVHYATGCTPQG